MRKLALALVRVMCAAALVCTPGAGAAPTNAYIVEFSFDSPDAAPGDNVCADIDGACTLRAAVMEANAHGGPDTIWLPAKTLHLTRVGGGDDNAGTGDLDLTGEVTLQGLGSAATIIDGSALGDRIFDVLTGTTASLSQLTLSGAMPPPQSGGVGGGVQNWGTLTLTQVLVTNNVVAHDFLIAGHGGGIINWGAGTLFLINSQVISNTAAFGGGLLNLGTMTIVGSQVSSNTGDSGAGVENEGHLTITASQVLSNAAKYLGGGVLTANGALTITASLFQGNSARVSGGGLRVAAGLVNLANVTVAGNTTEYDGGGLAVVGGVLQGYNLTIVENMANVGGVNTGVGGGLFRSAGAVALYNSLLAGNWRQGGDFTIADDCSGYVAIMSYNLLQEPGCTYSDDHNLTGVDPLLLPLAANGGPTPTSALGPGSPAREAGHPTICLAPGGGQLSTDQRGYPRPVDADHNGSARCDIGAFEAQLILFLPLVQR